jgi:hypothetical protein
MMLWQRWLNVRGWNVRTLIGSSTRKADRHSPEMGEREAWQRTSSISFHYKEVRGGLSSKSVSIDISSESNIHYSNVVFFRLTFIQTVVGSAVNLHEWSLCGASKGGLWRNEETSG